MDKAAARRSTRSDAVPARPARGKRLPSDPIDEAVTRRMILAAALSVTAGHATGALAQGAEQETLADMTQYDFGQPDGGLCQLAFVVEDIHEAMESFTRHLNVGPWFLMDHVQIGNAKYRGEPTQFNLSIANGYTGHLQIELVQQHDKVPSVFIEIIDSRGYGIHHHGIAVRDFDAALNRYLKMGYEIATYGENDIPVRAAYLDTKGNFPTFLEIMEVNDIVEAMFTAMYQASVGWTGKDPVRRITSFDDVFRATAEGN